jgi:hypothetical protein
MAVVAVAVHRGPFADPDQSYAGLGKYVTAREIGVDGPIREYYVVSHFDTADESRHITEPCWPYFARHLIISRRTGLYRTQWR